MTDPDVRDSPIASGAEAHRRAWAIPFVIVGLSVLAGWGGRRLFPAGESDSSFSEPSAVVHGSPATLSRGALLYQVHCAKCHGPDGRGDPESMARLRPPPRDFAERPWRFEMTFTSIRRVIAEGIPGTSMAAQQTALKAQELNLLADHVERLVKQLPVVERPFTPEQQQLAALGFAIERQPSPAPNLTVEDARGNSISLETLKGSWILLEFWGVSCEPCRKALPALERMSLASLGKHFKILPVCADSDDAGTAQDLLSTTALGLTAYVDATGTGIARFGIQALPMAWLIDPAGHVQATHVGSIDWDSQAVRQAFEAVLSLDLPP